MHALDPPHAVRPAQKVQALVVQKCAQMSKVRHMRRNSTPIDRSYCAMKTVLCQVLLYFGHC